jgi:hypothetical protein
MFDFHKINDLSCFKSIHYEIIKENECSVCKTLISIEKYRRINFKS